MTAQTGNQEDDLFVKDKIVRYKTGDLIGTYKIVRLLSSDNICQTYEVLSTATDKSFVLKLFPQSLSSDKSFIERFESEAAKSFSYVHTNIANIIKLESYSGNYFFIEELIRSPHNISRTLEDELSEQTYTDAEIQELAVQLCSALNTTQEFSDTPVVHHDLKPANILFDVDYQPKIKNIHLAHVVGEQYFKAYLEYCIKSLNEQDIKAVHETFDDDLKNDLVSMSGITNLDNTANVLLVNSATSSVMDVGKAKFIGAPYLKKIVSIHKNEKSAIIEKIKRTIHALDSQDHMSPEQKSNQALSIQSNIYSIGYILYRLLTGKKVCGSWGIPSSFNRHRDWDPIITKCLKRDPELRYSNYSELIKDINQVGHKKIPLKAVSITIAASLLIITTIIVKNCIQPPERFDFNEAVKQAKLELIAEREIKMAIIEETEAQKPKPVISTKKMIQLRVIPEGSFAIIVQNERIIREFGALSKDGVIIELPDGEYTFYAGYMGYEGQSQTLKLTNNNTPITFELKKYEETKQNITQKQTQTKMPKQGQNWLIQDFNIEMIGILPGQFKMGAPATTLTTAGHEMPLHNVKLSKHYWIGKYEVTQSIYQQIMNTNPSFHNQEPSSCPVENVSWSKAIEFCKRLTRHQRIRKNIPAGYEYRLPTEAEWEYACLAGNEGITSLEDKVSIHNAAWFNVNSSGKVHPVGLKEPNSWGLHDLHGNVWEWCLDSDYKYNYKSSVDPYYNYGTQLRVLRGGSWESPRTLIYTYSRDIRNRVTKNRTIGFRIVLGQELKY